MRREDPSRPLFFWFQHRITFCWEALMAWQSHPTTPPAMSLAPPYRCPPPPLQNKETWPTLLLPPPSEVRIMARANDNRGGGYGIRWWQIP